MSSQYHLPMLRSAEGGEPVAGNVQALCWPCNSRKSTRSMTELWAVNRKTGAMWGSVGEQWAKEAHAAAMRWVPLH